MLQFRPDDRLSAIADAIDDAATAALAEELEYFPKPGLVSFIDTGAHNDMDAETFQASIKALRGYFSDQARLGAIAASFERLRQRGLRAEAVMMVATKGVNTHRGAIFTLGLLSAAAGYLLARGQVPLMGRLSIIVRELWGEDIGRGIGLDPTSHGQRAVRSDRHLGARAEAAAGFPALGQQVWPQLAKKEPNSWLDALFTSMSILHDTNIVHRAGEAGLAWVQQVAQDFLASGGGMAADAESRAVALHHAFRARHISPGGSADLLAAGCFVMRLQRMEID